MTFWPGTKTPISRGNAFDLTCNTGHSVMWSQARESYAKAQGQRAARMKADELAEKTTAFTTYHLPGGAPKLSAKAREGLTNAKRHARDRKARGKA